MTATRPVSIFAEARANLRDFLTPRQPPTPATPDELRAARAVAEERRQQIRDERDTRLAEYTAKWPASRPQPLRFDRGVFTRAVA